MESVIKCFFSGFFKCIWIFLGAILGICYILSPLDLIPDVIPIIGWIDDLGVLGWMLNKLAAAIYRRFALWIFIIPAAVCFLLVLFSKHILPLPDWLPGLVGILLFLFGFWKIGHDLG